MKNKNRILSAAIAATLSFGMYSCGDLITEKKFEFKVGQVVAPVTVFIEDAKTGNMPLGLSFSVAGKDAAAVIHANNMDAGLIARNGILELGLREGMMPTEAKPYTFNLIAKADGYLNGILTVKIAADKRTTANLRMIKISELPAGATAAQGTGLATAAGPREDIRTSTNPGPDNMPTSNVVVERETAFLGESGEKLSGDVKVLVVQNAATGLISTEAGAIAPVSGLVTVEMTVGGSQVYGFANKKTKIAMEISSTNINMGTGDVYKAGDILKAWSRNDATGKWTEEGDVTVTKGGDGKLWGIIETSHLSSFAMASNWQTDPRTVSLSINKGNVPNGNYWMELKSVLKSSNGTTRDNSSEFGGSGYVDISNGTFVFNGLFTHLSASSSKMYYTAHLYYRKPRPSVPLNTSLRMGISTFAVGDINANVTLSRPSGFSAPSTTTFDLWSYCPGTPDQKILPSTAITFKEKGAGPTQLMSLLGSMVDGKFSTDMLTVGQTYTFNTTYTGDFDYTVKAVNTYSRPLNSGEVSATGGTTNPCN